MDKLLGRKWGEKWPFSLHFQTRNFQISVLTKPLKNRCHRSIGDFSFWCRLPDSDRRPTDYKYVVTQNGKMLSAFRELANAKQYITTYIKNNYPKLSVYGTTIGNEDSDFIECYDTSHNENEWI